jgi:hypothetical protein
MYETETKARGSLKKLAIFSMIDLNSQKPDEVK